MKGGFEIKTKKFYSSRYDRVFKTIFCNEDNPYLLEELLSRILKEQVKVVEFLRNELPVSNTEERTKIVDVLAKTNDKYIHIELNNGAPSYLHTRNFTFFADIFSSKVNRGESYDNKTFFLHIDFTYGLGMNKDEESSYYVQTENGIKYIDNFGIIEYNMDKIMKSWYNKDIEKVEQYKHLIMLDLEPNDLEELSNGDGFVESFNKEIKDLNEREMFQSLMSYEEDQRKILNTEKSLAREELAEILLEKGVSKELIEDSLNTIRETSKGKNNFPNSMSYEEYQRMLLNTKKSLAREEGQSQIIKSFIESGMTKEEISKITKISIEDIEKLLSLK